MHGVFLSKSEIPAMSFSDLAAWAGHLVSVSVSISIGWHRAQGKQLLGPEGQSRLPPVLVGQTFPE